MVGCAGHETFSARTLAEVFDIPPRQKLTTTIGAIHKALRRAYSDGKVVRYVDETGHPLREEVFTAPGSAAVEHPEIFGLPSAAPPTGYTSVTPGTEASLQVSSSGGDAESEDSADEPPEHRPEAPEDETDLLSEVVTRLEHWRADSPAPDWIPDGLLEHLVTLPLTLPAWRQGLDLAPREIKTALIRAGVKRRGGFGPMARKELAAACRRHEMLWDICVRYGLTYYKGQPNGLPPEDLVELAADPLGYGDAHGDCAAEQIVLTGYVLGASTADLELLAADAVDEEQKAAAASVEERLRHRADALEEELGELRNDLKNAERSLKEAEKRNAALAAEAERALAEQVATNDVGKQLAAEREAVAKAREEVASLEAHLDAAREDAARIPELEAAARDVERISDELSARIAEVEHERRLREQAENQVQDELRRVRELTQRMRAQERSSVELPFDDARALLTALAPAVGEAARHAADRLAGGRSQPDDYRLLKLAASYGELCAEIPPPSEEPPAEDGMATVDAIVANGGPAGPRADVPPASAPTDAIADLAPEPASTPRAAEPDPVGVVESDGGREVPAAGGQDVRANRRAVQPVFTVRALGGAEEVGGSALLVQTHDGANVLLDAGQRVRGEYGAEDVGQYHFGISGVDHLHGILISHAHIDHVGSLPLVVDAHSERQEADVPVWMSEPTAEVARIMLHDSAKIQEYRTRVLADLGEADLAPGTIDPAYTNADVERVMDAVTFASSGEAVPIPGTDLVAKFLRVPHVLGSCAIHLRHRSTGASLLYTGDLGPLSDAQVTLPDFGGTAALEGAELVIMESTYAFERVEETQGRRRLGNTREAALQRLADKAAPALSNGGFVLLPAFSLGRTQELMKLIGRERGRSLPDVPIYVGGMGERILQIYHDWGARRRGGWATPGEFPPTSSVNSWVGEGVSFEEAAHEILEDAEPGYLIVTPAMVSGGWSRAFLKAMVEDERHLVAFTGYLPKHAGQIPHLDRARKGARLRIDDREYQIRADWLKLEGLSAHAPARDLHRFAREITQMSGGKSAIACVHGEAPAQAELASWIETNVDGATGHSLHRGDPWRPDRR